MKKHSFQMTKGEIMELCCRAVWEEVRLCRFTWLKRLGLVALETIIIPWLGLLLTLFLLVVMAVHIGRFYADINRRLCGKARVLWVENGMLRIDEEGDIHSEIPCGRITIVKMTRHLLLLGWQQSPKRVGWYPVPLREFADQKERDAFLEAIRNPQAEAEGGAKAFEAVGATEGTETSAAAGKTERTKTVTEAGITEKIEASTAAGTEPEFIHLSFRVGEEGWKQILFDTTEIIRSGILGGKKRSGLVWMMLAAVCIVILGWAAWFFPDARQGILSVIFIVVIVCLALIRNRKENPENRIRRQLKKGMLQSNVYGDWEMTVTDMGVRQSGPGQDSIVLPWRNLCCLVETDTGLYFFQQDKRHFVPIPKKSLESWEQVEVLKTLCREKGLSVLLGKRMQYIPGWLCSVFIILAMTGYVVAAVRLPLWDSPGREYPDSVPLEEQVSVLHSLGFAVHDEVEGWLYENMQDEDIRIFVETYPYTWLLFELAVSDYGEKGDFGRIFWFDFEGWDISTDYIRVLEGMQELASGSILDDVKNIREDTEDVNWERGTGKITVLLEWNGQEYSWRMDMEHDWIDAEVLGIYNGLLQKEDVPERFYVIGDGGQGALVFFCTGEWAAEFERATGLELETYTVKKGW